MPKASLLWDDLALTIVNPPPFVLKWLTIRVKTMQVVQGQGKSMDYDYEEIWTTLQTQPFMVIQTMQGFCHDLKQLLQKNGVDYVFYDVRSEFPAPRLDLMHGFRFGQQEVTTKALLANRSGLISLPTRYGKTYCIANALRAYPDLPAVVTMPGQDLVAQTKSSLVELLPKREVKMIGGGRGSSKYQSQDGVTVCNVQSLHKCDPALTKLLIGDEVHALVSSARLPKFEVFENCRRLGFGATLTGRFDGKDKLVTGLFGPVLAERTYQEAVAEGAICQLAVIFLKVQVPINKRYYNRDQAYDSLLFKNPTMASTVSEICHKVLPPDWQTLVFIKHEKQADLYLDTLGPEGTVAMAKKLKAGERQDMYARMQSGEIKRCLSTNIYAQGVTFSDMRCMINCEGGGNNTSAIQKPGRLAEVRPGKRCGLVIDFLFDDDGYLEENPQIRRKPEWWNLVRDSRSRRDAYEEKGYEIVEVDNLAELKTAVQERM